MDSFKRDTIVDYTCWDLNCRRSISHHYNPSNIKAMFKRKARRKNKLELREAVKEQFYTNAEL